MSLPKWMVAAALLGVSAWASAQAADDAVFRGLGGKPGTLNLVLTNGRTLYALRRGKPLAYVDRHGLHDSVGRADSARAEAEAAALHYVMVLSDGPTLAPGWRAIEEGHVLVVDRDLRTSTHAL